ncbi:MAG: sigma 54-interacting transcriptional regulator [Proteobacteria bacterium]|nr:sigma 54-interacting transcriptional regulator [Pseudomonadota bacterium]MBU0965458.1 sigma 54-interacting transcriptional regulator [Pseudomonadota bacterium]
MIIKPKILLVDDDTDLLSLFTIRLQSQGFDVETAESGEQALARIPLINPHVLITDLRMGEMDGMALFEAVHRMNSSLPVIVITAHGSIPDAVEATKQGVFSFLTKPVDSQKLIQEIKSALTLSGADAGLQKKQTAEEDWCSNIVYKSSAMANLLQKAKLVAQSDASVLILGESGTGKEVLANAIHKASSRAAGLFVAVNCAAIPEALLESELFGHTKGSFTGAAKNYDGLFKSANNGTLFLDEIGDMPLSLQVKLLRVLQEKQVRPVGSTIAIDVDARIISATHRNIEAAVKEKSFREDLFYRLNVVSIEIPPLHKRREDIPLLAHHFVKKITSQNGKEIRGFSPSAMKLLMEASWPGNIRQLQNVVEQAVALSSSPLITENLLSDALKQKPKKIMPFAEARRIFEQEYLVQLLQTTQGNVTEAARQAKRNRTDFYKLLNRHHIVPSLFKE